MAAKSTHTQQTNPASAAAAVHRAGADSGGCSAHERARHHVPASAGGGRTAVAATGWILWFLLALVTAALLAFAPSPASHAQVQDIVTVPDAPQNLAASPGNGAVTLAWEEPADDGGAEIVRYDYRSAAGASVPDDTAWTSAGMILTVTVSDLTNGTAYAFEVRAVNGEGEGEAAVASATPVVDPVVTVHPERAAYRFAEGASDAAVTIVARTEAAVRRPSVAFAVSIATREVPGGASSPGDYGVLSVMISVEPDDFVAADGAWQATKTVPLTILEDDVGEDDEAFEVRLQPAPGRPAWVHLREADGTTTCGTGGCRMTVMIAANGPPSAPRNLSLTPGDGQVTLAWQLPAMSGGGAISGYQYRHAEGDSVPGSTTWGWAGQVLTVTRSGLTNGSEYAFEVRAVSAEGWGPAAAGTATPKVAATVPGIPRNLTATPGDGQVTFAWQVPASDGGAAIGGYHYRHAEGDSVPGSTAWDWAGQALTVTLSGLANGSDYAFEVRAVNGVGWGPVAAAMATPMDSATVPGVPRNLTATPGDGQAMLAWQVPADDGGAAISGYQYRHAEGASVPAGTAWASAISDLRVTLRGLADGTEHAFEVRAVNRVGAGAAAGAMAGVPQLPSLSVDDARAREGVDTVIDFAVALSRTSTATVSVDYATAEGSAKAGEDYRRAAGTLTFRAGETEKSVSVPLLNDAKDEGEETLTLALSNASGARIARGRATGTIANDDDAMPRAWLVRFGRTVAGQVVDAVNARLEGAPGSPPDSPSGSRVTVAGVPVTAGASALPPGGLPGAGAGAPWLPPEGSMAPGPALRDVPMHDVMRGSAFHLTSEAAGDGPVASVWGRVATGGFEAQVDDARMDGRVATGIVGIDAAWDDVLVGAAIVRNEGRGAFALAGGTSSERARGTVESTLTGVYPYVRARLNERTSVWALAGAGTGRFTLSEEGGAPIATDTDLMLGALGGQGSLAPASETGAVALTLKADAFWVRMRSDAMRSQATGNLAQSEGEATRMRLALQGERAFALGEGERLVPRLEVGLRRDGGDAETGTGLEAGAGMRYVADGVTVEGSLRTLIAHDADGYEEWGASGTLRIGPASSGRGLSLTLAPGFGATSGGVERLWSRAAARGFAAAEGSAAGGRVDAELGYGLRAPQGSGTITPYAGVSLADEAGRILRLGSRWAVAPQVTLAIETSRDEGLRAQPSHALVLRAAARW